MLLHKSVHVRNEVWKKLRLNSELSNVPLRDYLSYLILKSEPVSADVSEARLELDRIVQMNLTATERGGGISKVGISV